MKAKKYMGIWMDHSTAHLMELTDKQTITTVIESEFTHEVKEHSLSKGEYLMHNKEQSQQNGYYEKISNVIKGCTEVVLFGPTTAKEELANLLKKDHLFSDIKIDVQHADKMTENQRQAFVKDYFKAHKIEWAK